VRAIGASTKKGPGAFIVAPAAGLYNAVMGSPAADAVLAAGEATGFRSLRPHARGGPRGVPGDRFYPDAPPLLRHRRFRLVQAITRRAQPQGSC
jgi:hypothetical protein